jgi:hypothetical protein
MSKIDLVVPGISSLRLTRNPLKTRIHQLLLIPKITADTSDFDLDSDENSLASITEALGQRSELSNADDPRHSRRFLNESCYNNCSISQMIVTWTH